MPSLFPGGIDDSSTLPNPGANSLTNNPSHAGQHDNENDAIKAIEAKVGIGASTPQLNYLLTGTATGSSWQPAPVSAVWGLITGTLTNQTDLSTALNAKFASAGGTITGATTFNSTLTLAADPAANLQAATKQYVDALGSTTLVRNETPGGAINGSNTAYTTASTYGTGALKVYLNGQRLTPGAANDYVEVTSGFTMQYAPATGDVLLVDYETTNTTRFIQGSNSIIVQETPTGTVNGTTTLFTVLQSKYVANTLEVFINGLAQARTTDYAETAPGSGTFTFVTAPLTGDLVRVNYQFSTGASGNADTLGGMRTDDLMPIGSIIDYAGSVVPTANWVFAFGQAVSRTTFATLFTRLGTTYGTGDGSTTFNLPDLRGRVAAGVDNMGGTAASRLTGTITGGTAGALGNIGGEQAHALTTAELAVHNHGVSDPGHFHQENIATSGGAGTGITGTASIVGNTGSTQDTGAKATGITIANNGSGNAHNVVQPTLVMNKIIKVS